MPVVRMLAVDLSQATRERTPEDLPTPQPRNLSGRTLITVSKPTEGDDTLTAQQTKTHWRKQPTTKLCHYFLLLFQKWSRGSVIEVYLYHYSVVRSIAEKGPSAEEKISSLEAVVSNYEAKVSGLEHEMETQREMYETKLAEFTKR